MKVEKIYDNSAFGDKGKYRVTKYYGKEALGCTDREDINRWVEEWLGKDCITQKGKKGVVIGLEDSEYWLDYYLIVFIPSTGEVSYELHVDPIKES